MSADENNDSACANSLQGLSIKIFGEPASKANQRRVVRIGNATRVIKSKKALSYADVFRQQCPVLPELMAGDLCLTIHIWYASRRPDLDESLILDLLQGRVYINDRQVKERHTFWHLDKDCPRTEIEVKKISPGDFSARGQSAITARGE